MGNDGGKHSPWEVRTSPRSQLGGGVQRDFKHHNHIVETICQEASLHLSVNFVLAFVISGVNIESSAVVIGPKTLGGNSSFLCQLDTG